MYSRFLAKKVGEVVFHFSSFLLSVWFVWYALRLDAPWYETAILVFISILILVGFVLDYLKLFGFLELAVQAMCAFPMIQIDYEELSFKLKAAKEFANQLAYQVRSGADKESMESLIEAFKRDFPED